VKVFIEVIGWAAAAMMLSAYLLLTTGRLSSHSAVYQWLNVLSGAGFIANRMAIGLYGVARGVRRRPRPAA